MFSGTVSPNIAFVFQDPALMPWTTVQENVALPGQLKGAVDGVAISEAIEAVGLSGMEGRYPAEISGGTAYACFCGKGFVSTAQNFVDG